MRPVGIPRRRGTWIGSRHSCLLLTSSPIVYAGNGPFYGTRTCGGHLLTMSTHLVRALRAQAASRAVRHTLTRTPYVTEAPRSRSTHSGAKTNSGLLPALAPAAVSRTYATAADPVQDRAAQAQLRRTSFTHSRSCSAVETVSCPPGRGRIYCDSLAEYFCGRHRPKHGGTSIPRCAVCTLTQSWTTTASPLQPCASLLRRFCN